MVKLETFPIIPAVIGFRTYNIETVKWLLQLLQFQPLNLLIPEFYPNYLLS
jgi:hypothetical protein